jgi:subtilisin family serine protease
MVLICLELDSRGKLVYSAFPDSPADCSGHGTQVSSIIGGTNVGVAKQASLNVAQVLDCDGNGSNSDLIDAINWVIATHKKPAVINMSLGGPRSPSVDQAVRAAVDAGIPVVVAAGNENTDACTQSPAGVAEAFTIAAIAKSNTKAKFSNYGPCVDMFAPGVDILASAIPQKSRNGYIFGSGTSFSAPLVTGVIALFLEKNPSMTPAQVWDALSAVSAKSILVSSTLRGSPNILLQAPSVKFKFPILVPLSDSGLPTLGYHTSSIYSVELILIIIAGICAVIAFFATGGTIYSRYRNKKRAPTADIVPEADLKRSILNSQRPSVFL